MKPILWRYFAFYRGVNCWSMHMWRYSVHVYDAKDGLAWHHHISSFSKPDYKRFGTIWGW